MEINKSLRKILFEAGIDYSTGITYLLTLHFKLDSKLFPEEFIEKVHGTGIVFGLNGKIIWQIPLFTGGDSGNGVTTNYGVYQWVVDKYIPLFPVQGYEKESVTRMKTFVAKNPFVTMEEILEATELYIRNTDAKYVRQPHYFISKGVGSQAISDLAKWINEVRIFRENNVNRNSDRKLS